MKPAKPSKGVLAKSVQESGISDRRYVEAKLPKESVLALEMLSNGDPYQEGRGSYRIAVGGSSRATGEARRGH
jgi:hypothetical protein